MQYFTKDYLDFFKELSKNNNKEWFHSQKKRYEQSVRHPFLHFVSDLIQEVQKHEPSLRLEPKDCISRINRDIRFAKDKTPYNLHMTCFVSAGGKKDKSKPGIYLRFATDMLGIMGGCFAPDKEQLRAIRQAIINENKQMHQLLAAKPFKSKFGGFQGEVMKRIPKEYREAAEKEPLLLNKQFYFVAEAKSTLITSKNLLSELMDYYQVMKPMNDFLRGILEK